MSSKCVPKCDTWETLPASPSATSSVILKCVLTAKLALGDTHNWGRLAPLSLTLKCLAKCLFHHLSIFATSIHTWVQCLVYSFPLVDPRSCPIFLPLFITYCLPQEFLRVLLVKLIYTLSPLPSVSLSFLFSVLITPPLTLLPFCRRSRSHPRLLHGFRCCISPSWNTYSNKYSQNSESYLSHSYCPRRHKSASHIHPTSRLNMVSHSSSLGKSASRKVALHSLSRPNI